MRAVTFALGAALGANAQTYYRLDIPAFSCGNLARLSTRVNDYTAKTTMDIVIHDDNSNNERVYSSSHCTDDPVPATFGTLEACLDRCKAKRACSTKIWPEHCDQGCAKDCGQWQENANWHVFQTATTYSGKFHIKFSATTSTPSGKVGKSYMCDYDISTLLSGSSYCLGTKNMGAWRASEWPPTTANANVLPDTPFMQFLGGPWIKVQMTTVSTPTLGVIPTYADQNGALIDSPSAAGISDADKITGAGHGASCDGRCGAFAPGFGTSCSHTTSSQVAALSVAWFPTAASDCYCSCTTDCKMVGDCCDDYNLCDPLDLTNIGGVVATQPPTKYSGTVATGDPFTEHAGKRTQFYLPLNRRVMLLNYKGVELFGEAKPSRQQNDDQQWFKGFEVRYHGEEIAVVYAANPETLIRRQVAEKSNLTNAVGKVSEIDALKDRLARAKMELRATSNMRKSVSDDTDVDAANSGPMSRKSLRKGQRPLTTLNITLMGKKLDREVANMTAGDISVAVAQDTNRQIGTGFMESAWIEAPGIGFQLQSAMAQKFATFEDKLDHLHVNLKFNELNASACTGPLPEIWGVQPMSEDTIKMLQPLSKQ